ncbi:MAG: EamA family transporter [Hespellia sp.]|nr:EamA family transporter [Hespellia sp.]
MIMNRYYLVLVLSVLVASFSQILLKRSAEKEHESLIREYLNAEVVCGYGLLVLSTLLTIFAFSGMEYKNGPIVESLGYIFIMILSRIFLGEKMTKKKILGNVCILAGVFIYYI